MNSALSSLKAERNNFLATAHEIGAQLAALGGAANLRQKILQDVAELGQRESQALAEFISGGRKGDAPDFSRERNELSEQLAATFSRGKAVPTAEQLQAKQDEILRRVGDITSKIDTIAIAELETDIALAGDALSAALAEHSKRLDAYVGLRTAIHEIAKGFERQNRLEARNATLRLAEKFLGVPTIEPSAQGVEQAKASFVEKFEALRA